MHPARIAYQKPFRGSLVNRTHPLALGLVGCWLFNEHTGELACDLSGSGYDCAFDPTDTPTWQNGYVNFSSDVDYMKVTNPELLDWGASDSFTVMAKFRTTNGTTAIMVSKNYGGGGVKWWGINVYGSTGAFQIQVDDGSTNSLVIGSIAVDDGEWHVGVGVRNIPKGEVRIYVDGVDDGSTSETETSIENTGDFIIGARHDLSSTRDFVGDMEYVMVWNRPLTQREVQLLYQNPFAMFQYNRARWFTVAGPPPSGNPWYAYAQQ